MDLITFDITLQGIIEGSSKEKEPKKPLGKLMDGERGRGGRGRGGACFVALGILYPSCLAHAHKR